MNSFATVCCLVLLLAGIAMAAPPPRSHRRTFYNEKLGVPRKSEKSLIVRRQVNATIAPGKYDFSCKGRVDGFYADIKNECRVFHLCYSITIWDGSNHYHLASSFVCTDPDAIFSQATMMCEIKTSETFPCEASPSLWGTPEKK